MYIALAANPSLPTADLLTPTMPPLPSSDHAHLSSLMPDLSRALPASLSMHRLAPWGKTSELSKDTSRARLREREDDELLNPAFLESRVGHINTIAGVFSFGVGSISTPALSATCCRSAAPDSSSSLLSASPTAFLLPTAPRRPGPSPSPYPSAEGRDGDVLKGRDGQGAGGGSVRQHERGRQVLVRSPLPTGGAVFSPSPAATPSPSRPPRPSPFPSPALLGLLQLRGCRRRCRCCLRALPGAIPLLPLHQPTVAIDHVPLHTLLAMCLHPTILHAHDALHATMSLCPAAFALLAAMPSPSTTSTPGTTSAPPVYLDAASSRSVCISAQRGCICCRAGQCSPCGLSSLL
ncbi:hypothetical protein DFH07DRAFT_965849 [Mycena maculata]|uniref:Uncharacterized protein n=1 Tax=Mycena maculata TaxID=230809 RepID=A0AAD7IB26_9AGAR|nr:hypothetical protein DFH07DRAFT_965849 [Mycena maculata]